MSDFKCTGYTIEGKRCESQCSQCVKLEEGRQWMSYDDYTAWMTLRHAEPAKNKSKLDIQGDNTLSV